MKEDIKKLGWDAQLLHRQHNQEDITESFFRQEIRKLAEQYANQRVVEELTGILISNQLVQCKLSSEEQLEGLITDVAERIRQLEELKQ